MTDNATILVVEDDGLIGWHLADELQDAGFEVAGPFPTSAEALEYLSGHEPAAALLDVVLLDGTSEFLASALLDRGIPYVVHSGVAPRDLDGLLGLAPWVEKPSRPAALVAALDALLPDHRYRSAAPVA